MGRESTPDGPIPDTHVPFVVIPGPGTRAEPVGLCGAVRTVHAASHPWSGAK